MIGIEIYFVSALVVVPIVCLLNAWHARNERRRRERWKSSRGRTIIPIEVGPRDDYPKSQGNPANKSSREIIPRDSFRVINGGRGS